MLSASYNKNNRNSIVRKLKTRLVQLLETEDYEELKKEMSTVAPDLLEIFFEKEGFNFLSWALNAHDDQRQLAFFCENFQKRMLQRILHSDNNSIIRIFLKASSLCDRMETSTPEDQVIRIEKLKILMSIDEELVRTSISDNYEFLSEQMLNCCREAGIMQRGSVRDENI